MKKATHWKGPYAGIDGRQRERAVGQRTRWLGSVTDSRDKSLSTLWETVEDREAWRAVVHGGYKESDMT